MRPLLSIFFFFNDTATTEIYTLSLHDALPISRYVAIVASIDFKAAACVATWVWRYLIFVPTYPAETSRMAIVARAFAPRSEEHTSELQSHLNLVCRLLLEKKKTMNTMPIVCYHDTHAPAIVYFFFF